MDVEVISKTNGAVNIASADAIELNGASIVQLRVERSAIAAFERQGDDLILRMVGGETIRIPRFYVLYQGGDSDLVLIERDGGKWLAQSGSGVPRFVPLEEIDPLLAVGGPGGGGSGLLIPALAVGGAATGVGVGVAASGGGGGGNDGNGGNDGGSTPPDTIAPSAPTATITANGSGVSGVGEAGATVQVRSTAGAVVATGTVGADGNYAVALTPPRITGEPLSVIQTDAAGNASVPTTVTAPDLVAPTAPAATVSDDGAQVTGQGEPGARIEVRDAAGTVIGTAVAAADGSFAVALTTPQTTGGPLTIVQADAAGNVSAPVTLATPDLTAPDAPVVTLSSDGATVGGTGEPGATVRVIDGAGTTIATGTVGADGGILVALVPPANDGGTLTVVQADGGGNVSDPVTLATPDLTAPDAPDVTLSSDGATIGGTGEPGATVRVTDGTGTTIATGTVGADGGILVALVPPANDGGTLTIVQVDAGGNASPAATLVTPDATAPVPPVAQIAPDGLTVSGTGEPGATVTVTAPAGAVIGTALVGTDGSYVVRIAPAQIEGEALRVVQTDPAGNTSDPVTVAAPDLTAPDAPVAVLAPDGASISGTGEPGATVTATTPGGVPIGSGIVADDGSFVVTLNPAQANGETFAVAQTDRAGNSSPSVTLTAPDITAPGAPAAQVDADGISVGGTGEPGAIVRIHDPADVEIGSATVRADGTYLAPLNPPQTNGEALSVVQVDDAGNVSVAVVTVAPDFTMPAAPTAAINGDGTSVTGTGEAGATLNVTDADGTIVGTATIAADGTYLAPLTPPQADGQALSVVQRDAAGNASPAIPLVAPDITAPAAPAATIDPTGTVVTGSGEPGAAIVVRSADGTTIGVGTADARGAFAVSVTPSLMDGQTLSVVQADAAGNLSAATPLTAPDLTAPAAPVAAVSPDGASVFGTGDPGATVSVTDPLGVAIGSGVVAPDGSYAVTLVPAQIDGEAVEVVQADVAGNVSPPAVALAPDLVPDTGPDAPTALFAPDGASVSGTGEAFAAITARGATGAVIATGTAAADGSYTLPIAPPRIDGETVRVTQTDADGLVSPPATAFAPDLTAPSAPTATLDASGTVVTGTGERGSAITIRAEDGSVLGTATVNARGGYVAVLAPAQRDGETLSVVQTDRAGNASQPLFLTAADVTAPPAPLATVDATGAAVTGTGEPGATVRVSGPGGVPLGSALVAVDGSYVVPIAPAQANGQPLTVVQVDAAGNVSPATGALAPDLTAPATPSAIVSVDGTAVSGVGERGAVVTVTASDGTPLGSSTVRPNGSYTVLLQTPQIDGETLSVVQRDAAGNPSAPATPIAPDYVAPPAPAAAVVPDGTAVTGTGEAGATVTIRDADGDVLGSATVLPDGSFTVPLTPRQANGESLSVVQADAAGNASPVVPLTAPDITPPAIPVATVAVGGTAVTGIGEPGATVRVVGARGVLLGSALVATDGSFTVPLIPAQADGQPLAVVQADGAGNRSPTLSLTAPDITPPPAPTIQIAANGTVATGIGEPGARVTVTDAAGTVLGSATVRAGGGYVVPLSPPQTDGQILGAIQVDRAGNPSPTGTAIAPDMTAPLVPTATVSADGTTVSGTGVSGGRITVTGPDGTIIGTAVADGNGAYVAPLTPPQGNGEVLNVVQADGAGNVSSPVPVVAPDFTAPAAPVAALDTNGAIVTGSGEPGARISVTNAAGVEIGTTIVRADGGYAAALSPPQANGEVLSVTQTDGAGNPSLPTGLQALDVTAPPPPGGLIVAADGTSVSGQGEAGATVVVRDSAGTLLGSAVVAGDGRFVVPLGVGQTDGDTLSVRQTDGAGNQSGPALVVAPFDIVAFDNTDTAGIDLLAPTTAVDFGGAAYVLLASVGLLNLEAEVLGTPAVRFSVDPGHSLGAVFTYGAGADITALAGYSVVVQRFDGTRWVAADGAGSTSVLRINLLNGDLVATDSFGPGEYRAFLAYNGAVGLGVLGGLEVTGIDTDFTQVSAAIPQATDGNFITDANAGGDVDLVGPRTSLQSVTVNGVTTAIAADGTVVDGAWGTLIVDRDGSYTYTPDASPAAIGRTETIGYTLFDASDGETATATLSIAIGSPDIAAPPVAANDFAVVGVDYVNVETSTAPAQEFSFVTPTAVVVSRTASGADTFTVATNTTSDVTIIAARSGLLAVLPSYTIVVTDSRGTEVGRVTQTSAANLLGSGATLTIPDLPAGTYSYTVSSTNFVGTGYGTTVYISEVVTHLDRFVATDIGTVDGNVFDNDAAGSAFATLRIGNAAIGDPVTIAGTYGTLTIDGTGSYSYQPAAGLPYSTIDLVDRFTYQIVQPNGAVAEATLAITIDVPGGGGFTTLAADAIALDDDMLAALAVEDAQGADSSTFDADLLFAEFEGQGTPEDVLTRYLDAPMDGEQAGQATDAGMAEAFVFEPIDPLDYLAAIDEQDRHGTLQHPVL